MIDRCSPPFPKPILNAYLAHSLSPQKILDRAAQRSRQLGISDTSKFPLTEFPATTAPTTTSNRPDTASSNTSNVSASPKDPKNVVRFSSKKPLQEDNNQQYDNISVEINITTDSNVGVSHLIKQPPLIIISIPSFEPTLM